MTRNRVDHTFDYATIMKDAGLVGADAAAQVGGVDKIIDFGGADVRVDGTIAIDITVMEVATTDELYDIILQVSSSATFASAVLNAAALTVGALEAHATRGDGASLDLIGHYELPFTNERNGTAYRYARIFTVVTGTIDSGGINYTAQMVKKA